jgi:hypothetical protein
MGPSWATFRTCAAFHFDCSVLTVEGVEACDVAPEIVIEINRRGWNAPARPSESFVGQLHATLASA